MQFFRDGEMLDGIVVTGFPDKVRIGATPFNNGVTATLSFPENPLGAAPTPRDTMIFATLSRPGMMGITWEERGEYTIVTRIEAGSQASEHPELRNGLRLMELDGIEMMGIGFTEALDMLRGAGRPVTLGLWDGQGPNPLSAITRVLSAPAPAAEAAPDPGRRPTTGDRVRLADGCSEGCLTRGGNGVIREDDHSSMPFHVECQGSTFVSTQATHPSLVISRPV